MQHLKCISAPAQAQQSNAKQSAIGFFDVLEEIFDFAMFILEFMTQRATLTKGDG